MPMVVAMAILSTEIIGLVLGEQWLDAAPIFMILAVAAILQPVGATVGWVYVSLGQSRRMFTWICAATPLIVLSFIVGLKWGALGVASGYAISSLLLVYPNFSFALKHSPIGVGTVFACISRPFALSIVMGLAMTIARGHLVKFGLIWTFVISLVVGGIVFVLLARAFSSVWGDIQDIHGTAKLVFAKKK